MALELTQEDREFIWSVVDHAVEKTGSHLNLFANRLDFFDANGRIKFNWPSWMDSIKSYLQVKYGDNKADALLFTVLKEVMAEPNYEAYLRRKKINAFLQQDQVAS